jgi:hypothetical protein
MRLGKEEEKKRLEALTQKWKTGKGSNFEWDLLNSLYTHTLTHVRLLY